MKIKLRTISELIGGKIFGNPDLEISNLANIQDAKKNDLTFLYMTSYNSYLKTTNATAVLVNPNVEKTNPTVTYIEVDKPNIAFQTVINSFFKPGFNLKGIHQTSVIDPTAKIAEDASIGMNVIIEKNSIIGEGTKIYHNSVVMDNCIIGKNVLIHPNVTIREDAVIGDNVVIHSGTVIGSDGFGFTPDANGVYHKIPQIGNVIIEDNVEIGSNVSIDRAAIGSTILHKGVKLDNLIQIAHNVKIGENTVIAAQTGISGSTRIGKNCIFAGQVGSVGHIEITDKVIITAQSGITKPINKAGTYFGSPLKELKTALKLEAHIRSLPKYLDRIKNLEAKLNKLETQNSNDNQKESFNA